MMRKSRFSETQMVAILREAESFNGKFRDECLSMEWFRSRAQARVIIEQWRAHYNQFRLHSSLNHQTPETFRNTSIKAHLPKPIPIISGPKKSGRSTSPGLDEMGGITESGDHEETDVAPTSVDDSREQAGARGDKHGNPQLDTSEPPSGGESADRPERETESGGSRRGVTERTGSTTGISSNNGPGEGQRRTKKSRPKHKEQWDQRLLSYVRQNQDGDSEADDQDNPSEHNLAVEVVVRSALCTYEKKRGRVAEQMAQTHPGYDIIRRNPLTGEDRLIEIKGVNGEWNQTGVGLSRLQFSNVQDYDDRY